MKTASDDITVRLGKENIKDLVAEIVEPFYQAVFNDPQTKHYIADENLLRGLKIKQTTFAVCFFVYPLENIMDKIKTSSAVHHDLDLKMEYFVKYFFVWSDLVQKYIRNFLKTKNENEKKAWELKLHKLLWIMASHYKNSSVESMKDEIKKLEAEIDNELFYKNKISALAFLSEYEANIDMVDELGELHRELKALYEDEVFAENAFDDTIEAFLKYASLLDATIEFKDLGYAFTCLTKGLREHEDEVLSDRNRKFTKVFLENIIDDIETWRVHVFITKNAVDIHYLDDSLFSSIAQLELIIEGKSTNDDEDIFF